MQIEIDIERLSDDERYHLSTGLGKLENPSPSCKQALTRLKQLATESLNEHLRKYPGDWI